LKEVVKPSSRIKRQGGWEGEMDGWTNDAYLPTCAMASSPFKCIPSSIEEDKYSLRMAWTLGTLTPPPNTSIAVTFSRPIPASFKASSMGAVNLLRGWGEGGGRKDT